MSNFLPNKPEDFQEEPLQPVFEKNESYKKSKKEGSKNLIQKYYKPESFWEKVQNFISANKLVLGGSFATLAVVIGLVVSLVLLPNSPIQQAQLAKVFSGINVEASEVEIQPTNQDITGVEEGSDYILETKKTVTLEQVKNNLKVTPSIDFEVEKLNETKYKIKFTQSPVKNQIYKFQLQTTPNINEPANKLDLSWAFQIKDTFRVLQTLPRDKTTEVPTNTGIEIVFNNQAYQNPESLFSISPKTEGKFLRNGKNFTFVPKELQKSTLYTVILKAGLGLDGSDQKTTQETKFQFQTKGEIGADSTSFIKLFSEFSLKDKPTFQLLNIGNNSNQKYDVNVFKYPSIENFTQDSSLFLGRPTWAYFQTDSGIADSSKLSKVLTQKVTSNNNSNNGSDPYFILNKTLPAGYYLVETKSGDKTIQALFQVTDLAAYYEETQEKTLVWAVDLGTQKPAAGASVQIGERSATTDSQGVAFFDTVSDSSKQNNYFIVTSGDKKLLLPKSDINNFSRYQDQSDNYAGDKYWSYVYQDKTYYKTTDTINFWGYLSARNTSLNPGKVTAILENYIDGKVEIQKVSLNIQNNVFQSQFKFQNLSSGSYGLILKNEQNQILTQSFVTIEDLAKPNYIINIQPERKAYFAGENIVYNGQVKFFEGTPVPNLELIYGDNNNIKTDSQGNFQISYKAEGLANSDRDFERTDSLNVFAKNSEISEITASAQARVFNYKTAIEAKTKIENGKAKIELQLNEIDLSKINNGTEMDQNDYKGKPVADKKFLLKLGEKGYTINEGEEKYNLITKKTEKSFYYFEFTKELPSLNLKTQSDGKVSFEIDTKPESRYEALAVDTDANNSPVSSTINLNNSLEYGFSNENNGFNLNISPKKDNYDIGDKLSLKFQQNQNNIDGKNNLYLLSFAQSSLQSYKVQDNPEFNLDFENTFVPNVYINSIYFDGQNFRSLNSQNLQFNYNSKKLNIEVKTDKATYKPGEEVKIEALVRDLNGKPVNSNLNFSVVDEAIFATQPESLDTIANLYQTIYPLKSSSYISHTFSCGNYCGGQGSGGGEGIRNQFKDTAYFQNLQTDSNGQIKTSFKLPDDLTSWRMTFQGISSDLQAGSGFKNIITKLPFFVNPVINESYLVGDKPSIRLRTFGSELKNQEIEYTINSESLGITAQTVKGKGDLDYKLDALKTGNYKINIRAKAGELQDEIVKEFRVLSSYTTQTQSKFQKYSTDLKLEGSQTGATTLTFSGQGRSKYYQKLIELSNNYGDRVDQVLARSLAREILKNTFQEELPSESTDLKTYQNESGGIGIYSYADSDLELSAQVADLGADRFSTQSLKNYFNLILNSSNESRERKIVALYGLAGLEEPVLTTLNFLKNQSDLNPKEQIYLGLSLVKLGDKESARKTYKNLVEKSKMDAGETSKINIGSSAEEISINTSLIAILSAQLEEKDAPKFFQYLQDNYPKENLVYLSEINFLRNMIPRVSSAELEFSYILNDQKTIKKLASGDSFSLQISPTELDKLKVEVTKGELGILSRYQVPFESKPKDSEVEISRSFEVNGKKSTTFKEGDTVKVIFDFNLKDKASDGCYQITDYLPSGMKPLTGVSYLRVSQEERRLAVFPYNIEAQKVSFCVDKKSTKPLSYLARVVGKGEFLADRAIIQSTKNPNSLNYTDSQILKIN